MKVVDGLKKLIDANPRQDITNKAEYEIKYIEDLPYVSFFAVGPGGAFNASGDAYIFVTRKLPKKNKQLNIANHERVVLIIGWAPLIGKRDMIEALTQIDFSQYPNIDKVYFAFPKQTQVDLIYDRQVYDSFQPNGGLPAEIDGLFVSSLGIHLARKNPPGAPGSGVGNLGLGVWLGVDALRFAVGKGWVLSFEFSLRDSDGIF